MVAKADAPGLNEGLSLKFCGLKIPNHVKLTEECVICIEKYIFI